MARTKIHGYNQIQDLTIKNLQIATDAGIELSKLEKSVITADGLTTYSGSQSMGGYNITNLATPSDGADAATKAYVDAVSQGLSIKDAVTAATTSGITSVTYDNGASGVGATLTDTALRSINTTLDQSGLTLTVGETILFKNQAAPAQNGIYEVTVVGIDSTTAFVLTRITTYDEASEVTDGSFFFVNEGDNTDNGYVQINEITTMGTDAIAFAQFSGAGQVTAGDGIDKVGNTISVDITDFISTGLEDDGSNNIRLSTQGNGISGGAGSTLSVNPYNGITVDSNGVSINTDGSTLSVTVSGIKLADLTDSYILVGNASNVATGVAMSGDATIDNAGVVTLASDVMRTGNSITREVTSGSINGVNTTFVLANTPVVGSEMIFLNGLLQNEGAGNDYTISSTTITMNDAPLTGEVLLVSYLAA